MNSLYKILESILIFGILSSSCRKDEFQRIPEIRTGYVTGVFATSAIAIGDILDPGDKGFSGYGHCWSLDPNPDTSDNRTFFGPSNKPHIYTTNLKNLKNSSDYYIRSYAVYGDKIIFGEEKSFHTLSGKATVNTSGAIIITSTSATTGGSVTSVDGDVLLASGVCWDTTANFSLRKNLGHFESTNGVGIFICPITGLIPNTLYKVKAYAITSVDTSYGNVIQFRTLR
jgi:hypothetical protein